MPRVLLSSAALIAVCGLTAGGQNTSGTIKLSDVAGVWDYRATVGATSRTVVASVLTATGTTTGWTIKHENDPAVPVRVLEVGGDTIVAEAGPYPSTLRPGQTVSRLHIVLHYDGGDTMHGAFDAHYASGDVISGRVDAVRTP